MNYVDNGASLSQLGMKRIIKKARAAALEPQKTPARTHADCDAELSLSL